jgi:hypothetical protein
MIPTSGAPSYELFGAIKPLGGGEKRIMARKSLMSGFKAFFLLTPVPILYLSATFLKALDIGFPTRYI